MKTTLAVLLTFLGGFAYADTLEFYGVIGNGTGPYNLSDDGGKIVATCLTGDISVASDWQATLYPSTDLVHDPLYQDYREAYWLTTQFSGSTDWLDIHNAIWDLFNQNPKPEAPGDLYWLSQANANWATVPPLFAVIIPNVAFSSQTFITNDANLPLPKPSATPEPGTVLLSGLALLAIPLRRKKIA